MLVSIHDTYVSIHNLNFRYIIVFQKERETSLEYIIQDTAICFIFKMLYPETQKMESAITSHFFQDSYKCFTSTVVHLHVTQQKNLYKDSVGHFLTKYEYECLNALLCLYTAALFLESNILCYLVRPITFSSNVSTAG